MNKSDHHITPPCIYIFVIVGILTACVHTSYSQKPVIKSEEKIIITDKNNVSRHTHSNNNQSFNIEYKGSIEVTDDDSDIKSISRGGYLEISKTTFGSKRSLLIESTTSGLRREYYENRAKIPYEPEGKKWLAEILPQVLRSTSIAAESRVNRFYKKGGVDAVISEIRNLEGDYVRSIYGQLLLQKNGLSDSDLIKIAQNLSNVIKSDHHLAEILKEHSEKFLENDKTAEAYIRAVSEIGSDYYAAVILKNALQSSQTSTRSLEQILEASANISSDYYQSTLLNYILEKNNIESEVLTRVIEATRNINSDYYQSQILSKALRKNDLPENSINSILEAIAGVGSDYYMATVFSRLLENPLKESTNSKLISLIGREISSDYYAATVLGKMVKTQKLSLTNVESLSDVISRMGSSNYAASVIRQTADIKSLPKETLIPLIKAAGSIDSDYYAASALQALAKHVKNSDNTVKEAYRNAAKQIRSDNYFGQVMRAIE